MPIPEGIQNYQRGTNPAPLYGRAGASARFENALGPVKTNKVKGTGRIRADKAATCTSTPQPCLSSISVPEIMDADFFIYVSPFTHISIACAAEKSNLLRAKIAALGRIVNLWAKLPQSVYLSAFSFGFPLDFYNMITAGADEFAIMRDYQNGSAASCCLFQFLRNQPHVLSIKTTGWFVKDQNPALRKNSAGYGQALLLTAGHGRWVCIPIRIKPELLQ